MANAQLMEEELQQSVVLSEEDAEFEEDDIVEDTPMVDSNISLDPGPEAPTTVPGEELKEEEGGIQGGGNAGMRIHDSIDHQENPERDTNNDGDDESESDEEDLHDDDGAFDIDAEGEEDEEDEVNFNPKKYRGDNGDSSAEDEEHAEDDAEGDEEEDEDEAEGVGAVKIKPGETDEEDSESEPSDGSDSAFSDRDSGAESEDAVENDEDEDEDGSDEEYDAIDSPLRDNKDSDSESEAASVTERIEPEGDVAMDEHDENEGDVSPSSARRASAPQLARDLLPPQRALNKPDSHSMFNQLMLDEDPMDGSRVLRKRKTSSAEVEEDVMSLRKRRRNTPDESADGDTTNEQDNNGEASVRPRSSRSLRLKVPNTASPCSIVKKTRYSLVLKMRVNATELGQIMLRKPKSIKKVKANERKISCNKKVEKIFKFSQTITKMHGNSSVICLANSQFTNMSNFVHLLKQPSNKLY